MDLQQQAQLKNIRKNIEYWEAQLLKEKAQTAYGRKMLHQWQHLLEVAEQGAKVINTDAAEQTQTE